MLALPNHVQIPGLDKEGLLAYLAEQPDVVAAYLFGSHAEGRARPESDIDIAVLLADQTTNESFDDVVTQFDRRMELTREIERFIQGKELDLIVLNKAPTLLKQQVLTQGKLLFDHDSEKRIRFEIMTSKLYDDWKPMHDFFTRALLNDIKEVGLVKRGRRHHQKVTTAG
jgi:predicted nucleotidyltransferase